MTDLGLDAYLAEFDPKPTGVLFDANPWLEHPDVCLVAASLRTLGAAATPAQADEALRRLMADDSWPTFTLALPTGASVHVVWRNFEGDPGVDLLLRAPEGHVLKLGSIEGHGIWPGLSWPECARIAFESDGMSPERAFLVLLPFVGDSLTVASADLVRQALKSVGSEVDDAFVQRMLDAADPRGQLPLPGPAWKRRDGATTFLGLGSARGTGSTREFRTAIDKLLGAKAE